MVQNHITLDVFNKMVNDVLENNLSIFKGLTLTAISIDKPLVIANTEWEYSLFYANHSIKKKYKVNLKIPNYIITRVLQDNPGLENSGATYDITIKNLSVYANGTISISVGYIKEAGVSSRELHRRRLEKFCIENGYLERDKKPLPLMVTSLLAITSQYSEIKDDILSNINIKDKNNIDIVNCKNESEISKAIINTGDKEYDIIVLFRGGREDTAMDMFSSEGIIEAIHYSLIPVCVALGHEIDRPFIYAIADQTFSTPSSFAEEITAINRNAQGYLNYLVDSKIKNNFNAIKQEVNYLKEIEANTIQIEVQHQERIKVEKRKQKNLYIAMVILIGIILVLFLVL